MLITEKKNVVSIHSFKKKNLSMREKLEFGFNFVFADACRIFISKNNRYFLVCWIGFDLGENIVFFNKNAINRCKFVDLFSAIQFFIYLQNMVTQDLTWFKPEIFYNSDQFYEFAHGDVLD